MYSVRFILHSVKFTLDKHVTMKYSDIYKDCKQCPVHCFCSTIMGNSKVICSTMPSYEELEEKWNQLIEIGL